MHLVWFNTGLRDALFLPSPLSPGLERRCHVIEFRENAGIWREIQAEAILFRSDFI